MTARTRRIGGVLLMVVGAAVILASPWAVLKLPLLHNLIYDEGWALLTDHRCVWVSELSDSAAIGWSLGLMLIGLLMVFGGGLVASVRAPARDGRLGMKDANLASKRLDSARLTPPVYSCATCPAAQAQRWERDA